MENPTSIQERLLLVRRRISAAAERARQDPAGIRLIAVSKGQSVERIREACSAGIGEFGENYLEEAEPKIRASDPSIVWHMIGHVQGRKAKRVADLFPLIHSVDRYGLAERLSRYAAERGKTIRILLECNLSGEESKFGFAAAEPSARESLLREWERILLLPGIQTVGWMTMAPYSEDPENARPIFRRLRELRDAARTAFPGSIGSELSMGMTDDFEPAIEEGATMVRIGRALFGDRPPAGQMI
jgi:pyridoxal phosphate enzyme (YggS family)